MQNHIICFEDYQKATGYERHDRINYFQKNECQLSIESDTDVDTESMTSVQSYDQQQLKAELDVMMLNLDLKKEQKAEESDSSLDDLVPGMPYQELCLVNDDDDAPVGIQGVPTTSASEKMVNTKLGGSSKTMDKLQKLFEEEAL